MRSPVEGDPPDASARNRYPDLLLHGMLGNSEKEEEMREAVKQLWPELEWINDTELREKVTATWFKAFELSPLTPDDLRLSGYLHGTQALRGAHRAPVSRGDARVSRPRAAD
jgi:hypothetical protein